MAAEGYTTDTSTVVAHTGASDPHGDRAYARGHDVGAAETDYVNRPTGAAEGSDLWQARYGGARGLYANGYGCARARATVADQYAFRAQAHASAGPGQAIGSFALSDNTDKLVTRVNGDTEVARDLVVTRNVIVAGVTMSAPSAWTAATLGSGITAVGAPYPTPASRLEPWDVVRLRGRIAWTGSLTAGTTLLTLPAGHAPAETQTLSVRTGPSSNIATVATIDASGVLSLVAATGNSGYLGLDGLTIYRGAS